jgi:hypothetical protein
MLQGYRKIAAVALLLIPTILGFVGIDLPKEALQGVFDGFDKLLAAVLVILSIARPATSVLSPKP